VKKSFLSIIILVAISCSSDNPPESVMSEEDMIDYLIDLHIAEASVQNLRLKADSAKTVFKVQEKYLLKTHNITDSVFINSYNYYLGHPRVLEEIYSAVVDSISLRQSLLNEGKK
jgi:uncharacterized protein DUF4296